MDNIFCALRLAVALTLKAVYSHGNPFALGPAVTFPPSVRAADVFA